MGGIDTSRIQDLSLAASGNDLSVFWLYKNQDANRREIWGYTIDDAATIDLPETIAPNNPIYYDANHEFGDTINTDWDDQIDTARIVWTEQDQDDDYLRTRAGHIYLLLGQPYSITDVEKISNNTLSKEEYPVIAVNNSGLGDMRAFSQFCYTIPIPSEPSERILSRADLELSSLGDDWKDPVNRSDGGEFSASWITYRYFGLPRQIWLPTWTELRTEHDFVSKTPYHKPTFVKITTDRSNKTDIFTAYGDVEETYCLIQQLEP